MSPASKTVTYDSKVSTLATPTRTGYTFEGWYTDTNYSTKVTADTVYKTAGNSTVYAKWSENWYTVWFSGNGNDAGTQPSQINTSYTGNVTIPANTFIKNGYAFNSWNTKSDGTGTKYSTGQSVSKLSADKDGQVTLYAIWDKVPYKVIFDHNNGSGTNEEVSYVVTDTITAPEAPIKTGYTFAGWKVTIADGNWNLNDIADAGVQASGMYGNVTLTAQWTVNNYTVTFVDKDGNTVSAKQYEYGTSADNIEIPANTAAFNDVNGHHTFSWPTVSGVTGNVIYKEIDIIFVEKDGKEVELSVESGYIKWRYVDESTWKELIAITDLIGAKGDSIEFNVLVYPNTAKQEYYFEAFLDFGLVICRNFG